ncbi:MAG TPA: PH domain-containing protein [Candidatus Paceibacterota bacterium]
MITLQPEEKIILICRRHWLVFIFAIFPAVFMMAVILAVPVLARVYATEIFSGFQEYVFPASLLLLEVLWIVLFVVIADYYLDTWILTDQRLIFVELKGMFSRITSSVSLKNIQDVTTEVHGLLETLLSYGDVKVQSAGTEGAFIFKQIPAPYKVKDTILATRLALLKRGDRI